MNTDVLIKSMCRLSKEKNFEICCPFTRAKKGSNYSYRFTINTTHNRCSRRHSHTKHTHTHYATSWNYTSVERNFTAIFKLILQTTIIDSNFISSKRFRVDCQHNHCASQFYSVFVRRYRFNYYYSWNVLGTPKTKRQLQCEYRQ